LLTIGLDLSQPFPVRWSLHIPGVEAPLLQNDGEGPDSRLTANPIELHVAPDLGLRRVTSIVVKWYDEDGWHNGRLPTLVADDDELLPPAEFGALTCDSILDCLLSGRDPIEWAEPRADRANGTTRDACDPLKTIDTSTYMHYRTRRLARALAAISQRLLATLRTTAAMRHRLLRDPIGPVLFAQAMARETRPDDGAARATTVFALTELILCIAHVGQRVDRKGKLGLLPLFRETLTALEELRRGCSSDDLGVTSSLEVYIDAVRAQCEALVPAVAQEAASAG
jgi:hypothetical protein